MDGKVYPTTDEGKVAADCVARSTDPTGRKPLLPQRLSDEEIIDIRRKTVAKQLGDWADTKAFARAVELKVLEKTYD